MKIQIGLLAIGCVLFFSAVGCQFNTQEAVPQKAPLKLDGPGENCFGPSLTSLEGYFRGVAEKKEIDNAFECVSGALEMFATYGRGSVNKESFSSSELRAFLERHFLGSVKLNDTILLEFMRIKQSLLGGATDRLTKAEIAKLTVVLETLRGELQRLRPYIAILTQRETGSVGVVDSSLLEQAISDFTFSMDTVGTLLGQSKQPYRLENFTTLLTEIQNLYSTRSEWKGPAWFAQQMPLIEAAKAVLIRPEGSTIAPDEWNLLLSHVGRIYGLFLRFKYAIKDRDMFNGDALTQIEIGVFQIAQVLEDAIKAKGTDKIDYRLLNELFEALGVTKTFVLPIQGVTMKNLLEPLFDRIFNPVVIDSARGARRLDPSDKLSAKGYRASQGGLTTVNLTRLRNTLLSWIEMQQLWGRLEKDAAKVNSRYAVGKPIPIKLVRSLWGTYSPHHKEAWSDLKSLLDRPLPPATYPDGRLMLLPTVSIVIDRASFTGLNWKQQIVRAIGYGYVSDPKGLRMSGVTYKQLEEVFNDFWAIAIDLGFIDHTDGEIWKTGYTIANTFLPSSNGDDRVGFHEAVDLFMVSFGSGIISKKMIRDDVLANCEHGDLNTSGVPRIKEACWRNRVHGGYRNFFEKMPAWTAMAKSRSADGWEQFFRDLLKASRKVTNPSGPLASGEMDRVVSIHHYIEAVFLRFDTNQDGKLTMAEADKGYYLFQKILKEASKFSDDNEVHALYAHLLTFGKAPESFSEKLYWLWWKKNPQEWEARVEADRETLTTIFGNLASYL